MRLTWATVKTDAPSPKSQVFHVEFRTEVVALLSADCDLVDRFPPKRRGVLMSPLRDVPKNLARNAALLEALKRPTIQPGAAETRIPVNLFYFDAVEPAQGEPGLGGSVVYLESITPLTFSQLKAATKLAELTEEKRQDLRERLKYHFGRVTAE